MAVREAVNIGCCGFATRQAEYYRLFPAVELQSTFYKLPQARTAERWRTEAPSSFDFCLKAWQAITHPVTSPTWRRLTKPEGMVGGAKYGHLQPTRANFDAWEKTLEICNILRASVCLIQCPPSFRFSRRNVENVRRFFGQIDRGTTELAWEPRGDWKEHSGEITKLCRQLDLIHAVDPFKSEPAEQTDTVYFRLHGLGRREFNYRYNYSIDDLQRLHERILKTYSRDVKEIFVFFNNQSMLDNARTFHRIVYGNRVESR